MLYIFLLFIIMATYGEENETTRVCCSAQFYSWYLPGNLALICFNAVSIQICVHIGIINQRHYLLLKTTSSFALFIEYATTTGWMASRREGRLYTCINSYNIYYKIKLVSITGY